MFLKKKEKPPETALNQEPCVNRAKLLANAYEAEKKLEGSEGEKRIQILNELGSLYFQAGVIEKAICYYEASLDENKALGKPYTDLMKLYNIKRREAADSKDESEAKEYLKKIEGLMQLSKDVIRGRI